MANLQKWIKENRKAIDDIIKSPYKNDEERRLWTLNDEGLYYAFMHNISL